MKVSHKSLSRRAIPESSGAIGVAGQTAQLSLGATARRKTGAAGSDDKAPTSVSLFDQGLTQVLQAAVAGLGGASRLNSVPFVVT